MAWHGLWGLSRKEVGSIGGAGHRREASQQLSSRPMKRERMEVSERVFIGLQRIYHDTQAKPRSEGQASALQLPRIASYGNK
jgi:hypothetical protein